MRACSGLFVAIAIVPLACTDVRDDPPATSMHATETGTFTTTAGPGSSTATADTSSTTADGPRFDVGVDTEDSADDGPTDLCHVGDDMNAVGDCSDQAPPDSFTPDVQWTFGEGEQSWVTPLVGNFTDDDGDGEINLCDIPDVVLVSNMGISYGTTCYMHMLDGETGTEHFSIPPSENVSCTATPGVRRHRQRRPARDRADLELDGGMFRLKAFEHDGTLKWTNTTDGDGAVAVLSASRARSRCTTSTPTATSRSCSTTRSTMRTARCCGRSPTRTRASSRPPRRWTSTATASWRW